MSQTHANSKLIPGIGRIPFPAYRGTDPYIFVSYAHANAADVFDEIKRWNTQGYNIWYDEGIAPGNEWMDEIVHALENCTLFVVFITPESVASENVRDEIYFALDEGLPFIAIHLAETKITGGLRLRTSTKQAILKYKMSEEEYIYKYAEAFNRYGFEIPTILRNNEKTDHYEPLEMTSENTDLIAEIIFHTWRAENKNVVFKSIPETDQILYINEAIRTFCIAEAAGGKIYPSDYSMGIRLFASRIDGKVLEDAQKLYNREMTARGWTNGRLDPEKKTAPIAPLGYRSEQEEDRMERDIRCLQSQGYDVFRPISVAEKEAVIKETFAKIDQATRPEELERLRSQYRNITEIVDMINDAHFRV